MPKHEQAFQYSFTSIPKIHYNKHHPVLPIIFLASLLVACQAPDWRWTRSNFTMEQFNIDSYQCNIESANALGTRTEYSTSGGYAVGRYYVPRQINSYDGNAGARSNMATQCLRARGYYQVDVAAQARERAAAQERARAQAQEDARTW